MVDWESVEIELERLEEAYGLRIPGTTLCRVMPEKVGLHINRRAPMRRCLSVGELFQPKAHFYRNTVSECIDAAWEYVNGNS